MILVQKKIRITLGLIILMYLLAYFLIYNFRVFNIETLYILKYLVISVFIVSFVACCMFLPKMTIIKSGYSIVGIGIILFFLGSIFVFKIEDIFFWDPGRDKNREFFDFAFLLVGCNYVLALPYVALIISEIAFIRFLKRVR